jgi:hypothetical protein
VTRRPRNPRAAHETLAYRADPATQTAAAIAVAARSHTATEAAELLAMLGLLWPPESVSDARGGPADLALGELRQRRAQAVSEAFGGVG